MCKKEKKARLPEKLKQDLTPLVRIVKSLHLGTDCFGKRLTPKERDVLETTRKRLEEQILSTYDMKDLNGVGLDTFFEIDVELCGNKK